MLHLILPCLAFLASKMFPKVLFPAPSPSENLLSQCQKIAQRFIQLSIAVNALLWAFVWLCGPHTPHLALEERLGVALSLELPNAVFYLFLIIRVAVFRGEDGIHNFCP